MVRKLDRHLLPLFCVLTVLNYIDRWLHSCRCSSSACQAPSSCCVSFTAAAEMPAP